MRRILFLVSLIWFLCWRSSSGAVLLQIEAEEGEKGKPESFRLIDQATLELYDSLETSCFLGNFTLSAQPTTFDSVNLSLELSVFTLGPDIQHFFKAYLLKSGERLVLPQLRVKDNAVFKVTIVPHIVDQEGNGCNQNTENWYSDPSTHFYYHYIRESLPDFDWDINKGFLEMIYHGLWDKFGFWDPSKIDYFLAPCQLREIFWDQRHGIGLDPTKRNIYVLYNAKNRTVDGPGVGMFLFYKYWGYAPAFVVEGAAGYGQLGHHQAKKLKKEGRLLALKELEKSADYKSKPREVAFYEACSFIRYLVDTYGVAKFRTFYEEVTDLTFEQVLLAVYAKELPQLESEWLKYLDGFEELEGNLTYWVQVKANYRHYQETIGLLNDLLAISNNKTGYLSDLAGIYYTLGDYEKAESLYLGILQVEPEMQVFHNTLGNVYNILGDYAKAESSYVKAIKLDSNYISPLLRLGDLYLMRGRYQKAREFFDKGLSKNPEQEDSILIFLGLGESDRGLGKKGRTKEDLQKGLYVAKVLLNDFPERVMPYYYSGQIYLDMGFPDTALYYLETAAMLQDIPHKRGRVLLSLALAYRAVGEHELAENACQEILEIKAGAKEKKEAEKLLAELKKGEKR